MLPPRRARPKCKKKGTDFVVVVVVVEAVAEAVYLSAETGYYFALSFFPSLSRYRQTFVRSI